MIYYKYTWSFLFDTVECEGDAFDEKIYDCHI